MGDALSGILGTDSKVNVSSQNAYKALQPWQNQATQLANVLQGQANGTSGPNPAQQQYLQNAQNIAQQQAQAYSANRALNPGLAARMAGNTAANVQQTAAGQAGIQQAQQQLASQQLLGNVAQGQESALNNAGAVNAGVAAGNQGATNGLISGILGGVGSAGMKIAGYAGGGYVRHLSDGTVDGPLTPGITMPEFGSALHQQQMQPSLGVEGVQPTPVASPSLGANTTFEKWDGSMPESGKTANPMTLNFNLGNPQSTLGSFMSYGNRFEQGGKVPGKAQVTGDDPKNDKIPAMLSPGEIVIPRSKASDPALAKEFIQSIMSKGKSDPESGDGYGRVLAAHKDLESRLASLEKKVGKK